MTARKLRNFEEKINKFLQVLESSTVHIEKDFQVKFNYLEKDEVKQLYSLAREIEQYSYQQVKNWIDGNITLDNLIDDIKRKYPYLEEKRLQRVLARSRYNVLS